jgi:hypothetical protein
MSLKIDRYGLHILIFADGVDCTELTVSYFDSFPSAENNLKGLGMDNSGRKKDEMMIISSL